MKTYPSNFYEESVIMAGQSPSLSKFIMELHKSEIRIFFFQMAEPS
jgi:hypothetical protein